MGVRRKLIVLHTCFSLALTAILLLALRPALAKIVREAEADHAALALRLVAAEARAGGPRADLSALALSASARGRGLEVRAGSAEDLGLDPGVAALARTRPWTPTGVPAESDAGGGEIAALFVAWDEGDGGFVTARAKIEAARSAVRRLYGLVALALLSFYGLIAAAFEVFVLPRQVYSPIRRMLAADEAVQDGRASDEIIPESAIPADELGDIMRSRNRSIVSLRRHEAALADALARLEEVATDLRRKNHLLETARRNLADADRLASLGMMSAGIAHELNTPLAVLKGLVEKLADDPAHRVDAAEAELMVRVVRRLERLSESLLDFARARPPETARVRLRPLVEEALTLVRLDRGTADVQMTDLVPERMELDCDGDRVVQVLVNLVRNAVDAARRGAGRSSNAAQPAVVIEATHIRRDGTDWIALTVTDNGPGIEPAVLSRMFEPFVSTTLDARGTGLGLAVAEGIVREHGGVMLARNRPGRTGAVFEVVLPAPHEPAADATDSNVEATRDAR